MVLVIIGVLVVAFGYNTIGRTDDAKTNTAKIALASDFIAGINSYLSIAGHPADRTDIRDELIARGVKPTTPWGKDWSAEFRIVDGKGSVLVLYPLTGSDSVEMAKTFVRELRKESLYPQIAGASRDNSRTLSVRYLAL